jgi:hypothetical protein
MTSDFDKKLFRTITRQVPGKEDSEWLVETLQSSMDLSKNIPRIIDEGLAPLFFYHCRKLDILSYLPESSRKLISRLYQETFLINSHFIKLLEELGEILERRNLRIIILKGTSLLNYVYPDIGLRPMEDIDIMVQPESLADFKKILMTNGFKQDRVYPDTFKKGILHLDLHVDFLSTQRIQSRKEILDLQFDDVWKRAVPVGDYGPCIYRLSRYDNIIALLFHLLKHGYRRRIWFMDIKELIEVGGKTIDWQEILKHFKKARAERLMLYYLLLAGPFLGVSVGDDILYDFGKKNLSFIEKQILRLRLAGEQPGTMTDILWLYQIKSPIKKIRFILENIIPEKKIMQQIFPSSSISIKTFLQRVSSVFFQILFDLIAALRSLTIKDLPRI